MTTTDLVSLYEQREQLRAMHYLAPSSYFVKQIDMISRQITQYDEYEKEKATPAERLDRLAGQYLEEKQMKRKRPPPQEEEEEFDDDEEELDDDDDDEELDEDDNDDIFAGDVGEDEPSSLRHFIDTTQTPFEEQLEELPENLRESLRSALSKTKSRHSPPPPKKRRCIQVTASQTLDEDQQVDVAVAPVLPEEVVPATKDFVTDLERLVAFAVMKRADQDYEAKFRTSQPTLHARYSGVREGPVGQLAKRLATVVMGYVQEVPETGYRLAAISGGGANSTNRNSSSRPGSGFVPLFTRAHIDGIDSYVRAIANASRLDVEKMDNMSNGGLEGAITRCKAGKGEFNRIVIHYKDPQKRASLTFYEGKPWTDFFVNVHRLFTAPRFVNSLIEERFASAESAHVEWAELVAAGNWKSIVNLVKQFRTTSEDETAAATTTGPSVLVQDIIRYLHDIASYFYQTFIQAPDVRLRLLESVPELVL